MHKDHFLIINLCFERTYPTEKFHGRVVRFEHDDHNPPPLSTMLQFCVYVEDFLSQDKDNVVAVHCKGGKGRTGTMCCAWLLYSKPGMYAEQALNLKLFATYRTAQDIGGRMQDVPGPPCACIVFLSSHAAWLGFNRSLNWNRVAPRKATTAAIIIGRLISDTGVKIGACGRLSMTKVEGEWVRDSA